MTVKDVIKVQSTLLGLEDVIDYFINQPAYPATATVQAVDLMTRCINLVVSELAGSYIPMKATLNASSNEIEFKDFPNAVLEIIGVTDKNGKSKKYGFTPTKLTGLSAGDIIEYAYLPKVYGVEDEIGYNETDIPIRLLAYASCAEYSLAERAFDEAIMWRNRYIEELKSFLKPKNFKIKERGWS